VEGAQARFIGLVGVPFGMTVLPRGCCVWISTPHVVPTGDRGCSGRIGRGKSIPAGGCQNGGSMPQGAEPLACDNLAGSSPQGGLSPVRLWCLSPNTTGFGTYEGVFADVPIAEADRRHVASMSRRIAG